MNILKSKIEEIMEAQNEKQKLLKILSKCVVDLIDESENMTFFEHVDLDAVISVMDNAVFYMEAETKKNDKLNGRWNLLNNGKIKS
jgi:exonuclease V gamma subunit